MKSYKCCVCGAALEVSEFTTVAICDYCNAKTDLERSDLKKLDDNADQISLAEYSKQINRAAEYFEEKLYSSAFDIYQKLKVYTNSNIKFNSYYSIYKLCNDYQSYFLNSAYPQWESACDNSGNNFYEDYKSMDFTKIHLDYENCLEDCEQLIAKSDHKTALEYAEVIIMGLTKVEEIVTESLDHFLHEYSFKYELDITYYEGDKRVSEIYHKNKQAEKVFIRIAADFLVFHNKIYVRLIDGGWKSPKEFKQAEFDHIYSFLNYFKKDKKVPNTIEYFKLNRKSNVFLASKYSLASFTDEFIEDFYDYNLIIDPTCKNPLGSSLIFDKLCNYNLKIKQFANKYVEQGLISSDFVESYLYDIDSMRDDALKIRKFYRYGLLFVVPVTILLFSTESIPIGASFFTIGWIISFIYGTAKTEKIHKRIKSLYATTSRDIRLQASRERHRKNTNTNFS